MPKKKERIGEIADAVDADEVIVIDDSDGGVECDSDPCDRCGCPREVHEDGTGECGGCGECHKFKDPS